MSRSIIVLHVEDDPEFADVVSTFLEREDNRITVHQAIDSRGGLKMLDEDDVDCIISDYEMPGQNGIEFLKSVRRKYPDLPFILYTGMGSEGIASDAISAGVTDYLQKKQGTDQYTILANRIGNVVEQDRAGHELQQERNLLTGIVETSPVGIAVVDPDGELSFVNNHAETLYGRSREELNEFSHDDSRWDIVDGDDEPYEPGETPFESVVSETEPIYGEIVGIRRPSGKRVWLSVNGAPQWNEDGDLERVVFAFKDITEQRELETELTDIFGRVTDAFYSLDDEFQFTHVNDRAEELLQAPENELIGERLWDQYPEAAEIDEVWEAFHTAMEAQESQSYDLYFEPLDFWVEATVYPSESGVSVYFRDITERMEREEEIKIREQALRDAYEIIVDGDQSLSNQIDALLELGRDLIGTNYAAFSHIDGDLYEFEAVAVAPGIDLEGGETTDLVELPICERMFLTEQPVVINDVETETPELVDPTWGIACYLGAPVIVEDAPYGTFCFYDVDPRSEEFTEWETIFIELLTDWVGSELTQQRANDQLNQQNERLDDFVSVLSHDLRNPLTVAAGRLALVREECESSHIDSIEQAHERMQTLIEDLLALSREGDAVTDLEPVDITTMAEESWTTVETANATLVTDIDCRAQTDPTRLKQLFENLIRNAVEHGGEDVTITVGELDEGFYIEDDGPGIPESDRTEVFTAGFTTNREGTGFGLSIVKRVVEAHNWEIRLFESVNGGTRFEITDVELTAE